MEIIRLVKFKKVMVKNKNVVSTMKLYISLNIDNQDKKMTNKDACNTKCWRLVSSEEKIFTSGTFNPLMFGVKNSNIEF